jgi:hypothetical protein
MKIIKLSFIFVIFIVVNTLTASEDKKPKKIKDDIQIVSDDLQILLTDNGLEFKDSSWLNDRDYVKVDKSKVPEKVLAETTRWLKTMIKSDYLPDDPNSWLIPVRKPKSGSYNIETEPNGSIKKTYNKREGYDDYLITRYSIGSHKIQIQDDASGINLLIDVNDTKIFHSNIEQFIINSIYEFLNFPEDQKSAFKFSLKSFTDNKKKIIYFGIVNCNFDSRIKDAQSKRAWWNHTFLWTDGQRIYFSLVKMDGKPHDLGSATGGLSPRFNR